ncbi:hypothetical protein CVT24_013347 [Panaeolus cyanescens]|uniref:Uncharacterized protein n=1 Tax=Panaeolus cyanescens TaxID=181874 RepID=A0A409YMM0_9AGAR|nr:hypothetical protein CVT24_013347 [Panaeolus cyanescens]
MVSLTSCSTLVVAGLTLRALSFTVQAFSSTADKALDISRRDVENAFDILQARQDILQDLTTRDLVEELETRLEKRGKLTKMLKKKKKKKKKKRKKKKTKKMAQEVAQNALVDGLGSGSHSMEGESLGGPASGVTTGGDTSAGSMSADTQAGSTTVTDPMDPTGGTGQAAVAGF